MVRSPHERSSDPQAGDGPAGLRSREPLTQAEADFARELFEQHQLSLYRYLSTLLVNRSDAKEVLQETYLRLLRRPDFSHLRRNAKAYLFQIATNLVRDVFRQRASKTLQTDMDVFTAGGFDSPDWMSWPQLALEGEQACGVIVQALAELDAPVRSALLLNRFRDCTHQQIAARMGVSERTIERYIKQGLAHIAERLRTRS